MQRITSTLCTLTLSLAFAIPALAGIYRYRTSDGRWVITNTPPPAGTDATTSDEGTGATTQTTADLPPMTRDTAEPQQPEPDAAPEPALPVARPIDTLQFGLLARGMSQAEVTRRLGPPARVEQDTEEQLVRNRGGVYINKTRLEWWIYPAGSGVPGTQLLFRNGYLARKSR